MRVIEMASDMSVIGAIKPISILFNIRSAANSLVKSEFVIQN